MIQQTLAEELRFIHEHIEGLEQRLDRLVANSDAWQEVQLRDFEKYAIQPTPLDFMHGFEARLNRIDVNVDGFDEEFKAMQIAFQAMLKEMRRMADAIERLDG